MRLTFLEPRTSNPLHLLRRERIPAEARLMEVQAQNDLKAAEADLATSMGLPNEAGFQVDEESMPPQMPFDRGDRRPSLVVSSSSPRSSTC